LHELRNSQERETFDQAKVHEARWFVLRLVMGYASVILLAAIMFVASYVLFNSANFPGAVVTTAGAALFVDVLGLLAAVWRIALNPTFLARLAPVTTIEWPDSEREKPTTDAAVEQMMVGSTPER
jgi:hypothetical protein